LAPVYRAAAEFLHSNGSPRADNWLAAFFAGGELEVEGQQLFEQIVAAAEAVGLPGKGIQLLVQLEKLTAFFVEESIIEFSDSPLLAFYLLAAILV